MATGSARATRLRPASLAGSMLGRLQRVHRLPSGGWSNGRSNAAHGQAGRLTGHVWCGSPAVRDGSQRPQVVLTGGEPVGFRKNPVAGLRCAAVNFDHLDFKVLANVADFLAARKFQGFGSHFVCPRQVGNARLMHSHYGHALPLSTPNTQAQQIIST